MLKLGVNIDHVATVREARYRGQAHGEPYPIEAVRMAEDAGALGITAHLREDRRHMQDRDIWAIREAVQTRLNFEMANTAVSRENAKLERTNITPPKNMPVPPTERVPEVVLAHGGNTAAALSVTQNTPIEGVQIPIGGDSDGVDLPDDPVKKPLSSQDSTGSFLVGNRLAPLKSGKVVTADEAYLRESIVNPAAKIWYLV